MAGHGHNSDAAGRIKSFIERAERMEDEIAERRLDMKEIYAEAKSEGFDTKALKKLVALRKKDQEKLAEERAILEMYAAAIGMEIFG